MTQRIAVVGGGINGAGVAWELVRRGYDVVLYEAREFGSGTSSASSKLIHGGLRYLEHGDFRLVRESLRERSFLLANVPDLVKPLELLLPVYRDDPRSRLKLAAGLTLYDFLAPDDLPKHHRYTPDELLQRLPFKADGLLAGFGYYDATTDDKALVRRVMKAAQRDGLTAHDHAPVQHFHRSGVRWRIAAEGCAPETFDLVINVAGPWMGELLKRHRLRTRYRLSLVRGSHVVLEREIGAAALTQSSVDRRVVFVLPWKGRTMIGTTEVVHTGPLDKIHPSSDEVDYLLRHYNEFFAEPATRKDIVDRFAGVRPLISRGGDVTRLSREYAIEPGERMINVFGGKLTTFLSLARKVGDQADLMLGEKREAEPPRF